MFNLVPQYMYSLLPPPAGKERLIPVPETVKESLINYIKIRNSYKGIENQQNLLISTRTNSYPTALSRDGIGQAYDKLLVHAGIKQPGNEYTNLDCYNR